MIAELQQVLMIAIDLISPDTGQPRKSFRADEIQRLSASILARGILQPLRVVRYADGWRIVTGESRWRAAKLAELTEVPCIEVLGELTEADLLCDQITENMVRNDLRPMEEARALAKYKALKRANSMQVAAELGISGASITRAEALLSLPADIQAMVDSGAVPESSAYEISRLDDESLQRQWANDVASKKLSRDAVAEAVRLRIGKRAVKPKATRQLCKLDGGLSVAISGEKPLDWEQLFEAIDRLRKKAKKLCDGGEAITALARP